MGDYKIAMSSTGAACIFLLLALASAINICPGEGPRYGDYKCNHDSTHRVCARLKNTSGEKLQWGSGDFWAITSQPDWSSQVGSDPKNPGGDWCICMWATARLISQVGWLMCTWTAQQQMCITSWASIQMVEWTSSQPKIVLHRSAHISCVTKQMWRYEA